MVQVTGEEIKKIIIDVLVLEHLSWDEIDDAQDLFGSGLGLTSIDALELDVALRKMFDLDVPTDLPEVRTYFQNVSTLADYVNKFRKKFRQDKS